MSVSKIIVNNGYQSRKLLLCLILIMIGWILDDIISIDKLKILLDFTMYMFGIYAGANVGARLVSRPGIDKVLSLLQPSASKPLPTMDINAPAANPSNEKGD